MIFSKVKILFLFQFLIFTKNDLEEVFQGQIQLIHLKGNVEY